MQDIDQAQIKKLEEEYDPEMQMRPMTAPATWIVGVLLATLSCFHYYTAGFGLLRESTHRGVHLAFVLGLIFLVFGITRKRKSQAFLAIGGIPIYDWLLALIAAVTCFYVPYVFDDLAFRVGDPLAIDVVFGSFMIILTLEATRRSMGIALPLIALSFMLYGLFGQYAPGVLIHPGASWKGLVNHLYLTSQGIYGIAVGVVATYVFHFVLFGVLANRIGAGQLFIDLASCVAGRYAGGPAKVSVFSSALFGMISGSSIANTVTTGALTIPAMKRIGYRPHFAAAVEATSSTGGQITPPIMGAAAFIMIEFLELPYRTILLAATIPALMHYLGIFTMVHLEAKRLGLRGLRSDEMPNFYKVMREGWPTLIPLILLIAIIASGRTPYNAAFWGITSCIVVGVFQPRNRLTLPDLYHCFKTGAQYALAVGASAASVGIIVGVVSLTGMGFEISFMVTSASQQLAGLIVPLIPFGLADLQGLTLFLTLIFTAFACIIIGAGIPTTATYIVLVSIAAPALGLLGVAPIVAHFFVFYYGVLADITPPVALAAYAGAGIAGANPFKAGGSLVSEIGNIFSGTGSDYQGSSISAFVAIVGTMIAYFAAVVINFGDFGRFVHDEAEMKKGNLIGLPLNIAFFSFIALIVTAGTVVIFGDQLTNPTDIVSRVGSFPLTVVAAITFFMATIGINLVANFVPPAYDLANLVPSKIDFRIGGMITALIAFPIGALWVSVISQLGMFGFVNTLGAILAPMYGIMVADYYLIKKQEIDVQDLFSTNPDGRYYYEKGWNRKALLAFFPAALFSVASVWMEVLQNLSGYAWVIGAALGAVIYYFFACRKQVTNVITEEVRIQEV